MMNVTYPFAAIVGQDDLKQALILNAINPSIGGVLVKGPRGTGKSTLVRGITKLMPEQKFRQGCTFRCSPDSDYECPICETNNKQSIESDRPRFTELPLGASPDQVVGSLNVEAALRDSEQRLEPGILARANRGVLYVDEVNLLSDRLVDLLLDAAASGQHTVEREGISVTHPAEFIMVGTMNPDEGSLRPQIRDRFGLCVNTETIVDPDERAELARRVERFDRDPAGFLEEWESELERLRERIIEARNLLHDVSLTESIERKIAEVALDGKVSGHRADIVIRHTSRALASWKERGSVTEDDVRRAAELALEHRDSGQPPSSGPPSGGESPFSEEDSSNGKNENQKTSGRSELISQPASELQLDPETSISAEKSSLTDPVGNETDPGESGSLDVRATLSNTASRSLVDEDKQMKPEDVQFEENPDKERRVTIFLVDTSASMSRETAISYVKGMIVKTVRGMSYNELVSLVEFRSSGGQTRVSPTRRYRKMIREVESLPVGGNTPVAKGFQAVRKQVKSNESIFREARSRMVLVSDGRFSLSKPLLRVVDELRDQMNFHLVNAEPSETRWGSMEELADRLDCKYRTISSSAA